MKHSINVRLREAGNVISGYSEDQAYQAGDIVILEAERGYDYGEAVSDPKELKDGDDLKGASKIIRKATREDFLQIKRNQRKSRGAVRIFERKSRQHNLDMKLVGAEYSFDRTKIVFYFTSEERIDFRSLVRDLAKIFKARIELKQIGVRDEAKILGGYGICGRPLCCASFLKVFSPVTVKFAKEQNLPMNPTKISGVCGRLMCCLSYEKKFYDQALKSMPKIGDKIELEDGKAKVIDVNFITGFVKFEYEDGRIKKLNYKDTSNPAKNEK
ncbi:MAG: regulatory iron-sulfur-containing complex subunit RicT [Candidatus Omnitrophica bacterium]|nr:regulatory iron-sulfur-containing complex subunit RicT [Candidatus Omnitrophota bacterium]